ncbi:MAG: hypothetical protein ABI432_07890 [Flavobacteriales bacterium]
MSTRSILALIPVLLLCATAQRSHAQAIDTVFLDEVGRYQHSYVAFPDSFSAPTLSSRIDRLGRPYLYMACKDSGLVTLDISDPSSPVVTDRQLPVDFGDLMVMNLEQVGDLLYICLGNFQSGDQVAGLATVDVNDPANPDVLDIWNGGTTYTQGSAAVRINGGLAYLGAMEDGIIVLNVSDPSQIQFVSSYQPDPTWPGIASYPPNARGMAISGDVLFLAYDAGGLRAINISDPLNLMEIGHYLNPDIPALTNPAYNNVVVIGDRAYCTIDYCGIEVVDISDPTNMTQVAWLNPWNCVGLSWFGSDGHTNEIIQAMGDSLLFVSGGDSEVLVYDITDADLPVLKGGWIMPNDSAATWGVDVYGNKVVANFINNHGLPLQPYDSKYGGVVIFEWQAEFATGLPAAHTVPAGIVCGPNPTSGQLDLHITLSGPGPSILRLIDVHAREVFEQVLLGEPWAEQRVALDLSGNAPGIYCVTVASAHERHTATVALLAH